MTPNEPLLPNQPSGPGAPATKTPASVAILLLTSSALMMVGVFGKPLGIPSGLEGVPILISAVVLYLGLRLNKKAKETGNISAPTSAQKRRRFIMMTAILLVVSVSSPFWMPLTGLSLPFGTMVIISIVSFVISMGAVWVGFKIGTKA